MMDFRRRNLLVLGAAAVVSVALAAGALMLEARQGESHFTPGEFLPGFSAQVKNAARIHIVSHSGAFDVVYSAAKGWTLPAKGDYPADFNQVRRTLIGLAALQTVEPKTARADWLSYIGLDTPPKGNGMEITVSDASGHTIASVITGNSAQLEDPSAGGSGVFVRHPGDNQSYLARTVFTPQGELQNWVETNVMSMNFARVNSLTITPFQGPPITVSREHASDLNYKLDGAGPPKDMAPDTATINQIPDLVTDFAFTDVKPQSQVDFSKGAHLAAHTFDDQNIRMDAAMVNGNVWVRISAQPDPGTPTMQKQEAATINAKAANWAYELATNKGKFFSMKRDALFTKAQAQPQGGLPPGITMGAPN